ncbi:RNA polymerase-associated protein RapA [Methanobrevibacter cuticularis]|uniref:RNA polymerase-associated protein RapA n=1 Tax=Methanobrevibacter cuticularis TaxID=47311 RepID=A0A166ED00_9EURY|nr:SNF2-related protein [Methanobrevibacter cuticularis]KZX16520.1 RNA polymerase-associated protein RapA [Methanobrevibacter cuticularis]
MGLIEKLINWWTLEWLDLVNDEDLHNLFLEGKNYYLKKEKKLKYKIDNNGISEIQEYDRSFFGFDHDFSIVFKSFDKKTSEKIMNIILNSPFNLMDLLNNKFSQSLNDEFLENGIHLIPKSINDLTFNGYNGKKYSIETMSMFYFFSLKINEDPLLLFKVRNIDLSIIFNEYNSINGIKNLTTTISNYNAQNDDNLKINGSKNRNKKNIMKNERKNKEIFENTLNLIDFNQIPYSKDRIDILLESKPVFFKLDFKNLFLRKLISLSRFKNNIESNDKSKFDLNVFTNDSDVESTYKDKTTKNILFYNKWGKNNNFSKTRIKVDKNYNLKSINEFSHDYKTHHMFFNFFHEVPWWIIRKYDYKIQYIYVIYQFTLNLLEKIAICPELLENNGKYLIRWIPALFVKEVKNIFEKLAESCPNDLVLFDDKLISSQEQIKIIISFFIKDIMTNTILETRSNPSFNNIYSLFFSSKLTEISNEEVNQIEKWIFNLSSLKNKHEIFLSVSDGDHDDFNIDLQFINDHSDDNNSHDSVDDDFSPIKEKIGNLDKEYKFRIFSDLYLLESYFHNIKELIDKNKRINLTNEEFADFYLNTIPLLEYLNFNIKLPKNLKNVIKPKLVINMMAKHQSLNKESLLNLENLVDFDWKVAIADKELSLREFKKLVKKSSMFVKIDNKNYVIDSISSDKISNRIKNIPNKIKHNHLLQTVLTSKYMDNEVEIDKNILNVLDEIKNYKDITIPENLNGVLRPYQYRGFSWLVQNISIGFGSILADDMGLGKTLQVLTSILHFKNNGFLKDKKILIIVPTAILFNWQKEIEHFTPTLSFNIFHSQNKTINPDVDIIITSYGMVRANFDSFNNVDWFMIVVDEAQNIKNPNTKQTKIIKQLNSDCKIALTGTPVENCLTDYWSIFDFVNNGYLDGLKNFKQNYVNFIEKDRDYQTLEKFKKITSPFILRRLKTDKSIINDLPDKIVTECLCPLNKEQTALYQDVIDKTLENLETSSGIERKGLVFKLINSLKQICNHPSHFTKSDSFSIEESGKMEMLVDILENTEENNEKIIIFTQFVQMGNIIVELLKNNFKTDVMFYHGSLNRKVRDQIINDFQNDENKRILIISLKAGGTGLNLTAANHVVHFDLWWNPAVENQATDRVFRIGQKDNVFVYRFITNGTFEEKINQMLSNKRELAEMTVGTDEKFVTEMSNTELQELLNLKV